MANVQGPATRGGPTGNQPGPRHGGANAPSRAGRAALRPVRPVLDRGRRQLGRLSLGQVVALQAAAAFALMGIVGESWKLPLGVGAAALVAVPTVLPTSDGWLYQWCLMRLRFWLRVPKPVVDPSADQRLIPLRELLPELDVTTTEGRGGEEFGIVRDGQAWIALVGVTGDDVVLPAAGATTPRLPIRSLAEVLSVDDVRLAAVQVVLHTLPAPSGLLADRIGTSTSYQQLTSRQVPATQLAWIALRLDPALCPEAVTARGGGIDGVYRALRRCIARTVEVLDAAGVSARGLDGEEVRAALAASAGVSPRRAEPGTRHTGEEWRRWTCDGVAHTTYWLRGWPADPAAGMAALLERLPGLPTLFTTLSLTLLPRNDDRVRFQGMVRVSCASADAIGKAGSALSGAASAAGFRATRLDGEQAPAAFATMPLGGGVA